MWEGNELSRCQVCCCDRFADVIRERGGCTFVEGFP